MNANTEGAELFGDLPTSNSPDSFHGTATKRKGLGASGRQFGLFAQTHGASGSIRHGFDLDLAPLDATFRDSSQAPLHSWFPYIEGYSPRFVERVRREYLPEARRILEPFAGTGTTPVVLGQAGIACAFSEANPAMAFIAETKLAVLRLPQQDRRQFAQRLVNIARTLNVCLSDAPLDENLRQSYRETFGNSLFFDSAAFEAVLRVRKVNDEIAAKDKLLGDCFATAVLASLIPSSRLKRAGDLRYRTAKELEAGLPQLVDVISNRLAAQAVDMMHGEVVSSDVYFATATAKTLHEEVGEDWDGVITSPPYLNGTNYIRNARLELWYLRYLKTGSDLRQLRDRMITSGICDVHAGTRWDPVTEGVARAVRAIEQDSYDARIAKMVGGYFNDMAVVLSSLRNCLREGGRLCVDIGDSIYNGVHVATDDLLVEVAESLGFKTLERVYLRKRVSKGGATVRQQLLTFVKERKSHKSEVNPRPTRVQANGRANVEPSWQNGWTHFKQNLPHQLQPYAKREWGGPVHSMCSYQGKMKPALAHHLVNCFSSIGDTVVDPFSGAGTIPLEACRMGRRGYGLDISRLGHVLTLAKVSKPAPDKLADLLEELEASIEEYTVNEADRRSAAAIRFNSAIPDYFHPDTLREVLATRAFFLSRWNSGPEWAVLFACALHLLHGNRPYALSRRSHPVTPFKPTGPSVYRQLMPRLREKLARVHDELTSDTREFGGSGQADCTTTWPTSIPTADVIITSPPFFDSTRFYMTNWMRFWFVGWERQDFETSTSEFVETRQKQSLDVYRAFFEASRERLRDNGLLILHLGNSPKCDMGAELSKRVSPWFRAMDIYTEDVEHCESHGVRDKGTVHGHTYLVLAAE